MARTKKTTRVELGLHWSAGAARNRACRAKGGGAM